MSRDRIISIRVTDAEYETLRKRGGRVSDIVRRALLTSAPQPLPEGRSVGAEVPVWWGEFWVGQTYPKLSTS